jgi:polysaccharide export outer membrane protein
MKKLFSILTSIVLFVLCLQLRAETPDESLVIGPGDMLHVQVFDTPELEQGVRVTDAGEIRLLLGPNVKVAGLTPSQAAQQVREAFISGKYMVNPRISIVVEQYATQNVSILGQVKAPGSYPIGTPRSIVDVLALAGGLTDAANRHIKIERHSNPNQHVDYFLSNSADEALNQSIKIYPGDTIVVPKAGIVYVMGDVGRPGGYLINNNDAKLTLLQAVTMAGGTNKTSSPAHTRLMRKTANGYEEIQVQLADMQKGKRADMDAQPDDVIYIPFSYVRNVFVSSSSIISAAGTAAVYTF